MRDTVIQARSAHRVLFCVLALCGMLGMSGICRAETADLKGSIALAPGAAPSRTFRGAVYRNRLSASSQGDPAQVASRSPYDDVIVAAFPLFRTVRAEPLQAPARIVQFQATFSPHVTPVTPGTTVQFVNDDPFYHGVFSLTSGARFNIGRRPTGDVITRKIDLEPPKPAGMQEVKLFCDIHAQMNAIVLVVDTPWFARAERDGSFHLKGLPPGAYRVDVYQPDRPIRSERIELRGGTEHRMEFRLGN